MNSVEQVTVLIITKNGMPFLQEAIDSVLSQKYDFYKILVINDGSEDNTLEYIQTLNNEKISVISGVNLGIVGALNLGLEYVNTKYVAILDSDDKCEPSRLEKEINFLENHEEYALVGTSICYMGSNNLNRGIRIRLPHNHEDIIFGLRNHKFVLSHSTVMMRTDIVKECGRYSREFMSIPDVDLFVRMSRIGKIANISDVFNPIRIRDDSFTASNLYDITNEYLHYFSEKKEKRNLFQEIIDKYSIYSHYYSQVLYKRALGKYLNGKSRLWLFLVLIAGFINVSHAVYFIKNKAIINYTFFKQHWVTNNTSL